MSSVALAKAEIPPKPTNSIYVQDYAHVLSDQTKQKINRMGDALQRQTKAQIVVVTTKTLQEMPIEAYSLEILRQWGVGDRTLNNGVVMLVAVDDKKSRLEIGYGLEGALPDGKTGEIQDTYMLPYFKAGDYESGIVNGYFALTNIVADEYGVKVAEQAKPEKAPEPREASFFDTLFTAAGVVGIVALVLLDFIFFGGRFTTLILAILSSRGGRRGGGGGGFGGGSGGGGGSNRGW